MLTTYLEFRGETYEEAKKVIKELSHDELVWLIINESLNDFISNCCDDEEHAVAWWKAIPYIWWYWRPVDFYNGQARIWDCWDFIGFMQNNKRDYPERELRSEEINHIIWLIRDAKLAKEGGLSIWESHQLKRKHLSKIWEYMQTLKIYL